jgi:hypothetical protein
MFPEFDICEVHSFEIRSFGCTIATLDPDEFRVVKQIATAVPDLLVGTKLLRAVATMAGQNWNAALCRDMILAVRRAQE